jgi:hypothetical protein
MDVPLTIGASKGFGIASDEGDFWEGFRRGSSGTSSASEEDESNKSMPRAKAWLAPPPPMDTEDVFTLLVLTFANEAFSTIPSLEDCDLNFLLCFRSLAINNSYSEV